MKQTVQPRFRRKSLWRRIVTPRRIAVLGILSVIGIGVFTYFYFKYSRMLDDRLSGDVQIRTSGIYSQPRTIKSGQAVSLAELRLYLDSIGYVDASKSDDEQRGRYTQEGPILNIQPSPDAVIDNVQVFRPAQILFSKNTESIVRITDVTSKRAVPKLELEPTLLTAVSNSEGKKRIIVRYKDIPKDLVNAIVAIEDRRYYDHPGIDFKGLARAVWINVTNREIQQGGSTVTQQLVKNLILTPERTYKRKLQEAFIAIVLETRLSKDEIFQLYCNEIFLGQNGNYSINGVGEAARSYFDKEVMNMTLPECAFMAGIIRGPSLYSPYSNPERSLERRNEVLNSMAEIGAITPEAAEEAKNTPLNVRSRRALANSDAPYFLDYLQREMGAAFADADLSRQSLRIYSTIDMDMQHAAERAVRDNLANLDKIYASRKRDPVPPGTLQAALVAMDARTGQIVAMVGGRDYDQSQLNRAIDAHRQPGSVYKPIVYAAALESGITKEGKDPITAATRFLDAPEKFVYGAGEVYEPGNHGDHYSNKEVTTREGLVRSLNVVTVRIAVQLGLLRVQQMAVRLGLPKPPLFPATALGTTEATPLEIASAYTAFANLGQRAAPTGIDRVTNATGTTIRAATPTRTIAMKPELAYLMTNIMQDVMTRGTAAGARERGFRSTAAGKTGTSRDGWFAGYTPNLVCVVYVGFDDNSQLGLEGSKSALPIWTDFMKAAVRMRPELGGDDFPKPDSGIVEAEIDPESGYLATPTCPDRRKEIFIEGSQPADSCPLHEGVPEPLPSTGDDYSIPPYKRQLPPDGPPPRPPPPPPPPPGDRPRRVVGE